MAIWLTFTEDFILWRILQSKFGYLSIDKVLWNRPQWHNWCVNWMLQQKENQNQFFFEKIAELNIFWIFFNRCSTELERDGIWEIHTLLIKDISMDDGGNFKIKATNRVGTTEESGSLAIVTEEPSFPKSLESVTTKLGCTESFEVQIELIFLSK